MYFSAQLLFFLGGLTVQGRILKTSDIDEITTTGLYGFNFGSSGKPEGFPVTLGTMCVINSVMTSLPSVPLIVQTIYDYVGEVYTRSQWSGAWTAWKRCDNFGANTPAELASLLGGVMKYNSMEIISGTDLNAVYGMRNDMGVYFYKVVSSCINKPTGFDDGYMFVLRWAMSPDGNVGKYAIQILFGSSESAQIFGRSCSNTGEWREWKKVTMNSI